MNPSVIEDHLSHVLGVWTLIIVVAHVFGRLARRMGQPPAVGEIIGGILLGPSGLGLIRPDWVAYLRGEDIQGSMQLLGKLGLILLLFQVGLEFDFGHLKTRSKAVLSTSVSGILAPVLAGLAIGPWLHRTFAPDLPLTGFLVFTCVALSISALPIMGRILLERKLERQSFAVLAIGAAAIDDVVGWILLAMASALVTTGFDPWMVAGQIAGIAAVFLVLTKIAGPFLIRLWRRQRDSFGDDFPPGFVALFGCVLFLTCMTTHHLGIFSLFGAFLLGVALHTERAMAEAWRKRLSALVFTLLVPIFFTNNGLNTNVLGLDGAGWLGALVVLAAAVAGKLGGCYAGARWAGVGPLDSLRVASLMNTRALMGLVAVNVGYGLGLLNRPLFTMLVLMCLVTTVMCGPLLDRCTRGLSTEA